MHLDTLQEVVIDPRDGYKFIVANVTDGNGGTRMVVRAKRDCQYHNDILAILRREVRPLGLNAHCIGGGYIKISPEAKTIRIWDDSGVFGKEPDRQQTVRMLQAAFPEFQVSGQ